MLNVAFARSSLAVGMENAMLNGSVDGCVAALEHGVTPHGRVLRDLTLLAPETDFPSSDANPPLKIAVLSV